MADGEGKRAKRHRPKPMHIPADVRARADRTGKYTPADKALIGQLSGWVRRLNGHFNGNKVPKKRKKS
jgi:hypothetical protein